MVAVELSTFDSRFNWKVLTDNFMEAYHHVEIHGDTLEAMFSPKRSDTPDNDGPYSVLYMPTNVQTKDEPMDGDSLGVLVAAWAFPFMAPSLLACLVRYLMTSHIEPQGRKSRV
jgi:phenylpropionate dioxygenase-like ring-hydroxylating dioxygenase large terminal subunit